MLDLKNLEIVTVVNITYKNIITEDLLWHWKECVYTKFCQHNEKIPPDYILITT